VDSDVLLARFWAMFKRRTSLEATQLALQFLTSAYE
jgi:hypothetical protein